MAVIRGLYRQAGGNPTRSLRELRETIHGLEQFLGTHTDLKRLRTVLLRLPGTSEEVAKVIAALELAPWFLAICAEGLARGPGGRPRLLRPDEAHKIRAFIERLRKKTTLTQAVKAAANRFELEERRIWETLKADKVAEHKAEIIRRLRETHSERVAPAGAPNSKDLTGDRLRLQSKGRHYPTPV